MIAILNSEADSQFDEAMSWVKPQFTRNQVDLAGMKFTVIDSSKHETIDLIEPFRVLTNWRASHAFPLNAIQNHLRRLATAVDERALISQRLKRLESIERKLIRFPKMQMSQMQDIGGCRAILTNIDCVPRLLTKFEHSRSGHIRRGSKDYIETPKPDGYRGVHIVFQFTGSDKSSAYNKHRIEVQIRTADQHAWATAVEAVGTMRREELKSGAGNEKWLRFFALMSSAIALAERRPVVPGTPSDREALRQEITQLESELSARMMLASCSVLLDRLQSDEGHYFLVHIDTKELTLTLNGYRIGQSQIANEAYTELERKTRGTRDVVALISAASLSDLKKAYPNYFMDTRRFSKMIDMVVAGEAIGATWRFSE